MEEKGAIQLAALPSEGFYSRLFVVEKASGAWRPIIDLSPLNKFVLKSKFKMDTAQTALASVRRGDWFLTFDLRDAYLQVPIHPRSRKYLRFVHQNRVFEFRVLCFGLSTAPQVFTRVMAPVAAYLHQRSVRMVRYLDDWLILANSRQESIRAREEVFAICKHLNIRINLEKSTLEPVQVTTYLGMEIDSIKFKASPSTKRIETFLSIVEEFLSCESHPAQSWRVLLGHMASLLHLIPTAKLRMRSVQWCLRRQWNFDDESVLVSLNNEVRRDLA